MAGIGWRLNGSFSAASSSTTYPLCYIQPDAYTQLLIKEIAITFGDPNAGGGFASAQLVYVDDIGSNWTEGDFIMDNTLLSVGPMAGFHYNGGTVSGMTIASVIDRKKINVAGGEFFWGAIREEDKYPVHGGDGVVQPAEVAALVVVTDSIASALDVEFSIRGES